MGDGETYTGECIACEETFVEADLEGVVDHVFDEHSEPLDTGSVDFIDDAVAFDFAMDTEQVKLLHEIEMRRRGR